MADCKFRVYLKYLYEIKNLGFYDNLAEVDDDGNIVGGAVFYFLLFTDRYERQGYECDTEEPEETDDEFVQYMTRIPFYGSSGDPTTGEVTKTPTGMTDAIEIHCEKRPRNWFNSNSE